MNYAEMMNIALQEARRAGKKGEVPIGAAIFAGDNLISKGQNLVEHNGSVLYHAELVALRRAEKKIKNWRLNNLTLVSTLSPCMMCLGALLNARITTLIFAAYRPEGGIDFAQFKHLNIVGGVLSLQSSALLKEFFWQRRIPS